MIVSGKSRPKSTSPAAKSPSTPETPAISNSIGCCPGFSGCLNMGSVVSTSPKKPHRPSVSELEEQVTDLEREVQAQNELRATYKRRMETTQEYLRQCLQIAQEKGFLEFLIHPPCAAVSSPPPPPPPSFHRNPDLSVLVNQAKIDGWGIDPDEIKLVEIIGQGSTAEIYSAIWRGIDVAVKCISPNFFQSNENGVAFFVQELETLSRQRHPFVLRLIGACLDPPSHGWIVTELFSTTLKEWLHGPGSRQKQRTVPLPPFEQRLSIALEISQGMQYLHEQNPKVIHRDLKPSNIFLDGGGHVRVADFGHARFLKNEEMALTGETGTYVYMAPEVIRCEPYNEKCDVYSFGLILNELVTGNCPYIDTDCGPAKIAMEVGEGKLRPALPEDGDRRLGELTDLIHLSWHGDASLRPSFSDLTSNLRRIVKNVVENGVDEM